MNVNGQTKKNETDSLAGTWETSEEIVLGSMLRENSVVSVVLEKIHPGDMGSHRSRLVFEAILELWDTGKPAKPDTLAELLYRKRQIDDVGYAYMARLWLATVSGSTAEYHAEKVQTESQYRKLAGAGRDILDTATARSGSAAELLERAEKQILAMSVVGLSGSAEPLHRCLSEAGKRIDERQSGQRTGGVATGFLDLDSLIAGFQNDELVIIASRPSIGKTALALTIARNAAQAGHRIFFVSLEQSRVELAERLMIAEGQVNSWRLRCGKLNPMELERLATATEKLNHLEFQIDDKPVQSMARITATARRLKHQGRLDLVMLDYLQLVAPENPRDPRQEQVAGVSRRLKALARELGCPVVAMSQLNRGPEDRKNERPRLSDLRESGAIEQDADTVIMLHRPDPKPGNAVVEIQVSVEKQRNGPTGSVVLAFRKEFMVFENWAKV